ncbi:MAG TPA: glycosyltransferase family 2 protein [Clostridia bacterium]|nr:glycosyltransferase family 2 protein [Clostridia bacterium]
MITILMATYNGERFVRAQIESILEQTEQNFILQIQDDGSTDGTFSIISEYAEKYPGQVKVHKSTANSGGAKWNFLQMMTAFQDDYVMLCDQDDVWLPNKIEVTLRAMQNLEETHGKQTPILIHTDLTVVDESLNVIGKSLNKMLDLRMDKTTLPSQVVQNTVTGCTAMYNQALAQLIRMPKFCLVHDWWLGLVAVCFGKKEYLPERTMLYRQHGANSIGAKKVRSVAYIVDKALRPDTIRMQLKAPYLQAEELLRVYDDRLDTTQKTFLCDFISIPKYGKLKRWMITQKLGVAKRGFVRKIAQFLYI